MLTFKKKNYNKYYYGYDKMIKIIMVMMKYYIIKIYYAKTVIL